MTKALHDARHSMNALTPLAYLALLAGPHDKYSLAKILNVSTDAAKLEARRLEKMGLVIYRDKLLWIASREQDRVHSGREKLGLTGTEISAALEGRFAPTNVGVVPTRFAAGDSEADVSARGAPGQGSSGPDPPRTSEEASVTLRDPQLHARWLGDVLARVAELGCGAVVGAEANALAESLDSHGLDYENTTAQDAAELWYDWKVSDLADEYERNQSTKEEDNMQPQTNKNQSQNKGQQSKPNGTSATPPKKDEPKPKTTKSAADALAGKTKAKKVKFYSAHKLTIDGKESQADYTVRVLDTMVEKHGRPRDPWGDEMKIKTETKGADSAEKAARKAAKKVEKEQRAKEKEERKSQLAKMTDEQKKEFAKKEREQRQAEKNKKQLAERAELEAKIRAEIAAGTFKL